MSAPNKQPTVSGSAVIAAGLASATAAVITSRFGVAGTLIGAALTTMIITGGSAVLKAYLQSVTGQVRKVPGKVRQKASQMKHPRDPDRSTMPGRPDLRNNFVGRLRAAFDWFRNLAPLRRRSILIGALVPAVVAFFIAIGGITAVELAVGKSLSCLWNDCPGTTEEAGTNSSRTTVSSLLGGSEARDSVTEDPAQDQQPGIDSGQDVEETPSDPSAQPAEPAPAEPAPEEPAPAEPAPAEPAPAEPAPSDPSAAPSDGSEAPSGEPVPSN